MTESVESDEPTTETRGSNNSNHQQPRCEKHLKENKFGWESTQKWVEAREFDGTKPKMKESKLLLGMYSEINILSSPWMQ